MSYPLTPKLQMTFEKFWHIGIGKLNDGPEGVTNIVQAGLHVQMANKEDFPGVMPGDLEAWLDLVDGVEVETRGDRPFRGGSAERWLCELSVATGISFSHLAERR